MREALKWALLSIGVLALPMLTAAQDFKLFDRDVQIHGFASQGFVYTNDNNWLTMNTSDGSGAMTDFGVNGSMAITDKFRIGAQFYDRNLGALGDWHPTLDWATASYRFAPWFGVRGGKVKTVLGLYNDTQDLDFLHPFALLPQSIYPTDLRESTIAHMGGDLYGDIALKSHLGTLSYTAYAGQREDSQYGGYPYLLRPIGINLTSYGGLQYGGDLRWSTPLTGLLVGISRMNEDISGNGTYTVDGTSVAYSEQSKSDWINQFYLQYTRGSFEFDSEFKRYWRDQSIFEGIAEVTTDVRGWYASGAYRFCKWFQAGTYFSQYYIKSPDNSTGPIDSHIYDKVVTGRFDLNRYVVVKLEGHFMNGYGAPGLYPEGFYTTQNPDGFQKDTNALVLKTSFRF